MGLTLIAYNATTKLMTSLRNYSDVRNGRGRGCPQCVLQHMKTVRDESE